MAASAAALEALEARVALLEEALRPHILAFGLPYDGLLLFFTKFLRMFAYGGIAPIFFLYLLQIDFTEIQIGVMLTCISIGDLGISLYLTTRADGFGRRNTLVIGCLLKILAGVVFALTSDFYGLIAAGVIGVISTSGGEIGPFLSVEQAALMDAVVDASGGGSAAAAVLTGWYSLVGYIAQALGALGSGLAITLLQSASIGWTPLSSYRAVFIAYGIIGGLMGVLYMTLSRHAEAKPRAPPAAAAAAAPPPADCCPAWIAACLPKLSLGLRRPESKYIVARLSIMFMMDAFGGAFVMQTWIAFWFSSTWSFDASLLGYLLMGSNVVAGISGLAAAFFVKRCGAMLTMIATHLPSNVLLLLIPFMPSSVAAAVMLVARFSISQMDVPARQAYVQMVVASDERSAAGGITNILRSLGASLSPLLLGYLSSAAPGAPAVNVFNSPWLIAGGIKILYDIILYTLYRCDGTMTQGEMTAAKDRAEDKAAAAVAALRPVAAGDADKAQPLLLADDEAAELSSATTDRNPLLAPSSRSLN